jgi:phenylalanyl-tRNA synthetase alpha chain
MHTDMLCDYVYCALLCILLQITLVDEFVHPKTGRQSKCFRFNYRSMDRSLTNNEIDALQVSNTTHSNS